ncbi:hypothetical protein D3C72_1543720 [compost metagenome]
MRIVLSKWINRLFSYHRNKESELIQASSSVSLSINRYRNLSKEIQAEIERNHFAKYLVYDRGEQHGN